MPVAVRVFRATTTVGLTSLIVNEEDAKAFAGRVVNAGPKTKAAGFIVVRRSETGGAGQFVVKV
jgi:hypothetical protein